jgi:hypothetical protein
MPALRSIAGMPPRTAAIGVGFERSVPAIRSRSRPAAYGRENAIGAHLQSPVIEKIPAPAQRHKWRFCGLCHWALSPLVA